MNNHQNHKSQRKISISGSVSGRHVIIVDDMIDTGQTIKEAIEVRRLA
jgi:phosphoribosylpyrophosphate synthetase